MSNEHLMEQQKQLEILFNKNQLMKRLRQEFIDAGVFIEFFKENKIDEQFGLDLLSTISLHKRADVPTLVGALRNHFAEAQEVLNQIIRCCELDLLDYSEQFSVFVVKYDISADVQLELEQYQYPLPMVVPPNQVKDNKDNGYLAVDRGSLILRNNHHDDDICLDHINRLNKVKLCLDMDTAMMVKNTWANLDKPKEDETCEDYDKRVRAFQKYDRTAKEVMDLIDELGNEFYLTHKYDKRGRTYSQGYHVNYQGAPWNKAVIEFANKEVING